MYLKLTVIDDFAIQKISILNTYLIKPQHDNSFDNSTTKTKQIST